MNLFIFINKFLMMFLGYVMNLLISCKVMVTDIIFLSFNFLNIDSGIKLMLVLMLYNVLSEVSVNCVSMLWYGVYNYNWSSNEKYEKKMRVNCSNIMLFGKGL